MLASVTAAPQRSPSRAEPEQLSGPVERITFHSAESGYGVLRVKVRGQRDLVTVVGHAAAIGAGEHIEATGVWINDRTHGLQLKVESLRATVPTTLQGLEKYLGSGMIKGIGPFYAKKLVTAFGQDVFEVIERAPGRLREVTGIGPVREAKSIRGWTDQRAIRETIVWLYRHGVSSARAVRIFKTYGDAAVAMIKADPYRLARDIAECHRLLAPGGVMLQVDTLSYVEMDAFEQLMFDNETFYNNEPFWASFRGLDQIAQTAAAGFEKADRRIEQFSNALARQVQDTGGTGAKGRPKSGFQMLIGVKA